MELYRVITYSTPNMGDGKNYVPRKQTVILQSRRAVANRLTRANTLAANAFIYGGDWASYVVTAEILVNDEWEPIDGHLFTCEQTDESKTEWNARHA
jgi:hypothetical protein